MLAEEKIKKGKLGESIICSDLIDQIDIYYKMLRNVIITNVEGKKTEIDILFITACGIFVIESKNFKGWIFGNKYRKRWTQTLWNKQHHHFPNPLHQNYYHIKFLKRFLNFDDSYFTSYIVFGKEATLKQKPEDDDLVKVLKEEELKEVITKDMLKKEIVLSHEQVDQIYFKLKHIDLLEPISLEEPTPLSLIDSKKPQAKMTQLKWKLILYGILSILLIGFILLTI